MFLAIFIEAMLWALLYLSNPLITALPELETALYFSMVTFTTLGYGEQIGMRSIKIRMLNGASEKRNAARVSSRTTRD